MRVYFAGPLFTPYERTYIDECTARLRAQGVEVFNPFEVSLPSDSAATVFTRDLAGLSWADAMVVILDGAGVDDGSACEVGIFYALMQNDPKKKGIVGLLTDVRRSLTQEGHGINFFVAGCVDAVGKVCGSFDEVLDVLAGWRND